MVKQKYKYFFFLFIGCILFLNSFHFFVFQEKEIEIEKKILGENITNREENVKNIIKKKKYIGILEIPRINLQRGFYDFGFKENNVNQNIEVIESSLMPNQRFGNLILAAHSGNSKVSYFKNLYKLEIGDIAYVYYVDKYYTYQLVNVYDEEKDGTVLIRRNNNQTNLTLITCDKNAKDKQNVYIFALISDLEEFQQ